MNAADWTYQEPRLAPGNENQRRYRATNFHEMDPVTFGDDRPRLSLFRFDTDPDAELTLQRPECGELRARLNRDQLLTLRNALNDALHDVDAFEADRERRESFEAIQDELSMLEDGQQPACYYGHPDVHYVPADQVAAKVCELEAAGAKRYLVMPEPQADERHAA